MKHFNSGFNNGILFDVDGVLLNWVEQFDVWIKNVYSHLCTDYNPNSYDITRRHGIKNPKTGEALIRAFNSLDNILYKPPARGDITFTRHLCKDFTHAGICSCFSNDQVVVDNRIKLLKKIYGKDTFKDFAFLDICDSKEEVLQLYKSDLGYTTYIEDSVTNANIGASLGYKVYLIKRPWNFDIPLDSRVIIVDSIENIFLNKYETQ